MKYFYYALSGVFAITGVAQLVETYYLAAVYGIIVALGLFGSAWFADSETYKWAYYLSNFVIFFAVTVYSGYTALNAEGAIQAFLVACSFATLLLANDAIDRFSEELNEELEVKVSLIKS